MFFAKEFNPKRIKKCDTYKSRSKIIKDTNKNLIYLFEKRFIWMKKFIKNKKNIIELGSGNGSLTKILKNKNILLTDIVKYPWIGKKIDMAKLNLGRKYLNKVDVFIINHSLHHCCNPAKSIKIMSKYLKKNGVILINEPEISFSLKFLQFILDDEPWSLKVNIFNSKKNIFKSNNPWASNTAVARLLFDDEDQFNHFFPEYKICRNDLSEFFIFFNSGGVYNEAIYIPLNKFFLKLLDYIDSILIFFFPKIFALNRTIILKKIR